MERSLFQFRKELSGRVGRDANLVAERFEI
jgi:hypothetical protein